ncbi:MAG TPA: hypothetical protein VL326_25350 [Kofleriaceae bacterium]|jgi:hypothetical protein|nr:hypothetical protein [Kofleriaceae bacterium]
MKRSVAALVWLVACAPHGGIKLAAPGRYEVGEEATISIDAPGADSDSPVEGDIVMTRPDGSVYKQHARLTSPKNRIKIGDDDEPTFMATGRYRLTFQQDAAHPLAAPIDIAVNIDRLTEVLSELIVEYKAKTRFTKPRANGHLQWKQYGGIYEHPWQKDHEIEVVIEEPGEAFKTAWKQYEEQGVLQVIQKNYVRLREGADTTMAAWTSEGRIIVLRATDLAKFDPKFIARFFARYPSDLKP